MNKLIGIMMFVLLLFMVGCETRTTFQRVSDVHDDVVSVEKAVNTYYKEKKVLPYLYRTDEHTFTTNYLVDFRGLKGYLSEIPTSAFERGGNLIYVLTNVPKHPQVKVFDLRIQNIHEEVQLAVNHYKKQYQRVPLKEKIGKGIYTLHFNELNLKKTNIPSPYHSNHTLDFLVDDNGKVYVDYRFDMMRLIQDRKFQVGNTDLRDLLSQSSLYVPSYAPIMKYEKRNLLVFPR